MVAFLMGLPVESAFALLLTRVTELIMCQTAKKITDKKKGESNLFGEDD